MTKENIREDLLKVLSRRDFNMSDWRLAYIVPITMLAVLAGILLKNIWIALLIFSLSLYQIVRYMIESREGSELKKFLKSDIARDAFAVSTETLSHIAEEVIYEPHVAYFRGRGRASATKTVPFFHFRSGASWRVPAVEKHYQWSKLYYMSSQGLDNTSISGDTFYYVSLQEDHEIAYVYNTKLFDWKEEESAAGLQEKG